MRYRKWFLALVFLVGVLAPAISSVHAQAITSFDPPGSIDTRPTSINPAGEITGFYRDSTGTVHGFGCSLSAPGEMSQGRIPSPGAPACRPARRPLPKGEAATSPYARPDRSSRPSRWCRQPVRGTGKLFREPGCRR